MKDCSIEANRAIYKIGFPSFLISLKMASKLPKYNYLLILDFEATTKTVEGVTRQEMIEWPTLLVKNETFEIIDTFHQYIKPKYNSPLHQWSIDFTGIQQTTIDAAQNFESVYNDFLTWIDGHSQLQPDFNFTFVTCGDWDLKTMLPKQLAHSEIEGPSPEYFQNWVNIKKLFTIRTGLVIERSKNDLLQMMSYYKIEHVGKLHSGIQDVQNIKRVVEEVSRSGEIM